MSFVIWVQSYDVFFIKLQAKTKQKPTETNLLLMAYEKIPRATSFRLGI